MLQDRTTTTERSLADKPLSCGVTVFEDRERPPKVGVWYDPGPIESTRIMGFPLTQRNINQLHGCDDDGISTSHSVYELVRRTVRESDAEWIEPDDE